MEEFTQCEICLEQYDMEERIPLMLLCGHSFCKQCILRLHQTQSGVICPTDRIRDGRAIGQISKNYAFINIIQKINDDQKRTVSYALERRREAQTQAEGLLLEIENFDDRVEMHEQQSINIIDEGFRKIRAFLTRREQELKSCVRETHQNLKVKVEESRGQIDEAIDELGKQVAVLEAYQRENGPNSLVQPEFLQYPEYSVIEKLRNMISKLPIKVIMSCNSIENSIDKSMRIVDETQSRPSQYQAAFISHVRVNCGDMFIPSANFVKTWKIKNTGQVTWPEGCWCIFSNGDFEGEPVVVDSAWANEEVDVSVVCTAPEQPGNYQSHWRLVDNQGLIFGPTLTCEIQVVRLQWGNC